MKVPTFADFAETIRLLPTTQLQERDCQGFLFSEERGVRVYYAPFDWVDLSARIAIVGITPGKDSMLNGIQAAAAALREGRSPEECCRIGKQAGSFSNMRRNICSMLNELGVPAALGIQRAEELFQNRADLLHTTSCVRYPIFIWESKRQSWANYGGHSPDLLSWPLSRFYIENILSEELRQIPEALIVPCGKAVDQALVHLCAIRMLDANRCLFGFPHASGNNGHRAKFFETNKAHLTKAVARWATGGNCDQ